MFVPYRKYYFDHYAYQACRHSAYQACRHSAYQACRHSAYQACRHSAYQACRHSAYQACRHSAYQACRHSAKLSRVPRCLRCAGEPREEPEALICLSMDTNSDIRCEITYQPKTPCLSIMLSIRINKQCAAVE